MTRRQTLTRASVAAAAFAWAAAPAPAAQWRVPRDFRTIQAAVDSPRVGDGDVILLGAGRHSGAVVTKAVEIRGNGKAVIVDGPRRWPAVPEWEAGFYFPGKGQGSGASLVHLRFEHVDLPVFSAGADDVTVARCTLERPLQGITNWGGDGWGNGWDVTGNTIQGLRSACAGGIGILVGDYAGGRAAGNLVAHNVVRGWLRPAEDDCGGYDGSGIVLYADFRDGREGASAIEQNRVSKNRVHFESADPDVVGAVAVELTDTRDDGTLPPVVHDNAIVWNDLRGMDEPIVATPQELAGVNRIEKNRTGTTGRSPDRGSADRRPALPPARRAVRPVR
jgi:hypothetical protein